jgi:hypothetical protein
VIKVFTANAIIWTVVPTDVTACVSPSDTAVRRPCELFLADASGGFLRFVNTLSPAPTRKTILGLDPHSFSAVRMAFISIIPTRLGVLAAFSTGLVAILACALVVDELVIVTGWDAACLWAKVAEPLTIA